MKKYLILAFFLMLGFESLAQNKIGIKIAPALSFTRASTNSDTLDISSDGSGVRFIGGSYFDFIIDENYYFSTGLFYGTKRAGFTLTNLNTQQIIKESYNLQYLQIPLTLKLYTNEVKLDTRVYVQFGLQGEILVDSKENRKGHFVIEDFRTFDSSVLIGTGFEFRAGLNTILSAGLSYSRGLIDSVSDEINTDRDLMIKNDMLSLDIGVKF